MKPEHRDIARIALQSAVASAAAYLIIQWTGTGEVFLAVISAVLVLQTNRDETIRSANSRLAGTIVGTIVGGIALALTAASGAVVLALAMLVMGGLAAWKSDWRYGLVAAAGLAVGSDATFWETAHDRGIAIFAGAAAGVLSGLLVWPESAPRRARRQMAGAISLCRELLNESLSAAVGDKKEEARDLHARFANALSAARDTAGAIKLGGGEAAGRYRDAVHAIERLWHALIILDRVTETKTRRALPLKPATPRRMDEIRRITWDALACLERFERVPPEDLQELDEACRAIWRESDIDPAADDELQSVALVFGLGEVARNVREIDETVCAIGGAG